MDLPLSASVDHLLGFEPGTPSQQKALDLFAGSWISRFPPTSGLAGGDAPHFDDSRVTWAASVLGGLHGRSILELGPFEAYNTYQFQMAGAAQVTAIESSRINFLKCLVVKNVFNLHATFLLGDFLPFLAKGDARFDICWASGILYHMKDPLQLLAGIRRCADTAFVWTHYFDHQALAAGNNLAPFDAAQDRRVTFQGRDLVLHHRSYGEAPGMRFSGGDTPYSYWLERHDIMAVLAMLGFDDITMGIDNPEHPSGPAMFFLARATRPSR